MVRVRLLTYHFSDNFGALLQAYALREWFLRQGIEAEFINYHPHYVEEGGDFDQIFNPHKWRKNLVILYMKQAYLRRRLFGNRAQAKAFEKFRREQLGVGSTRLETLEDLSGQDDCDLLVCGSDQIWNPSAQQGLDPAYFLSFGEERRVRRISYAASFGKSNLDATYHKEAERLLIALDSISVRELSGVNIVRDFANEDAVCVPDPTILLGDFSELLKETSEISVGYVFCYALRSGEMIREVATLVGDELQTDILSPYNAHRRWSEIGTTIFPSPCEWVRYLKDAAMVVTNSFHGVALSVILQKPFVAVSLPGKKKGLNERVHNLLGQLGLLDRLLENTDKKNVRMIMKQDIDWPTVTERLEEMRADGSIFLEGELAKIHLDVK